MRPSVILEHPCFQEKCHGQFGRIHLPVAPKCTIQCAFCDRKYDSGFSREMTRSVEEYLSSFRGGGSSYP